MINSEDIQLLEQSSETDMFNLERPIYHNATKMLINKEIKKESNKVNPRLFQDIKLVT